MATSVPPAPTAQPARSDTAPIRTVIVRVTIGSFSLAALLGIVTLLIPGEFGYTQAYVFLSTLLIGGVCLAALCYLPTVGRPSQPVGVAGVVAALVTLVAGLVGIWVTEDAEAGVSLNDTFWIGTVVAVTLAQASLLLVLGERAHPGVRRLLIGTLALAVCFAVLSSAILAGLTPSYDGYFHRLHSIVLILDVLGTAVVATLVKFGDEDREHSRLDVSLPADLTESVADLTAQTGRSSDEIIADAVRSFLQESR